MGKKMKKVLSRILSAVTVVAVLIPFETASSEAAVQWKGVDWSEYQAATLFVNPDNEYLEVRPYRIDSPNYCAAYHTTPDLFRSANASTPWVEVTFVDDPGKKSTVELWLTDKVDAWTQIGAWDGSANYCIFWWNMASGERGIVDTGVLRAVGQHTIKLGLQQSGALDYWLNDTLVWSTDKIRPQSFGEIYLATLYSVGTFVDYQYGMDYSPPTSVTTIELDIRPGANHNTLNLKSKGVVAVAVLSNSDFDATDPDTGVDPDTLLFAGAAPVRWKTEDVEQDGDLDLLCHFKTQELILDHEATEASLSGITYDGKPIEGTDSVRIILKAKKCSRKWRKSHKKYRRASKRSSEG